MISSPSIWHLLQNVKSTVKILKNFVTFLENMNFNDFGKFDILKNFHILIHSA